MQSVAQNWLVLELTNSPFLAGPGFVPWSDSDISVLSDRRRGGDRADRRKLLVGSQIVQMSCAFLLATLVRPVEREGLAYSEPVICRRISPGIWRSGLSGVDPDSRRAQRPLQRDRPQFNSVQSRPSYRPDARRNCVDQPRRSLVLHIQRDLVYRGYHLAAAASGAPTCGKDRAPLFSQASKKA